MAGFQAKKAGRQANYFEGWKRKWKCEKVGVKNESWRKEDKRVETGRKIDICEKWKWK